MKFGLLSIFFLTLSIQLPAQSSLSDLSEQAKVEQKNILIVFSGSDWCAPCIRLKTNVLDQVDFQEFQKSNGERRRSVRYIEASNALRRLALIGETGIWRRFSLAVRRSVRPRATTSLTPLLQCRSSARGAS